MNFAERVKQLPPYLFVGISRSIAEKKKQGIDVISFGIGDPDIPTPDSVIEELKNGSDITANHRYPETEGLPEYRKSVADFYKKRFNVTLDPETEVINLIGAKEGIAHAPLCFIDPGDIAICPNPAYPVYEIGTMFAGGSCHMVTLEENKGYLLDPTDIPTDIAKKSKILWINYPNNPTGAIADKKYFENIVNFCLEYDIALLHDACYTEVTFDGYIAPSILEIKGAMDISIEFHSLSKTANMTGWRVGTAVGNPEMINALMRVKSNIDSGLPQAIQQMGIKAFDLSKEWLFNNNEIYRKRRDKVVDVLNSIGVNTIAPKAGLYIWTPVPQGYTSAEFASELLEKVNVVVTPGNGYGTGGEGYIRLSLTIPDDQIDEGLNRLSKFRINS